jgi:RNA polymerase sigma-70 factor (ECF subfamily)
MRLLFSNIKNLSDEELVERFKQSEQSKFVGVLYERYSHLVLGVCLKYLKDRNEALDQVSSIFEKLLVDLKKHKVDKFKPWLFMVSKNHCLMLLRSKKNQYHSDDQLRFIADESEEEAEMLVARERRLNSLEEAIELLKAPQQTCIRHFYLEKKSYREIGQLTGYSAKQVKSNIQNGKRNLRLLMEQRHEEAI